jgi:3'-phosphoadenosine 5'-phosphosulfate (PAPS) 3'-phosphatase
MFARVSIVFHITIPGQGIVDLAAGKVVIDAQGNVIFQANPNRLPYTQGDVLICAALS